MEKQDTCPKCGSTNWKEGTLVPGISLHIKFLEEDGSFFKLKRDAAVKVFACANCGYMELYAIKK